MASLVARSEIFSSTHDTGLAQVTCYDKGYEKMLQSFSTSQVELWGNEFSFLRNLPQYRGKDAWCLENFKAFQTPCLFVSNFPDRNKVLVSGPTTILTPKLTLQRSSTTVVLETEFTVGQLQYVYGPLLEGGRCISFDIVAAPISFPEEYRAIRWLVHEQRWALVNNGPAVAFASNELFITYTRQGRKENRDEENLFFFYPDVSTAIDQWLRDIVRSYP